MWADVSSEREFTGNQIRLPPKQAAPETPPREEAQVLDAIALIHATQRSEQLAQSARPVRPQHPFGPPETRR
jgi:hypothetical protein